MYERSALLYRFRNHCYYGNETEKKSYSIRVRENGSERERERNHTYMLMINRRCITRQIILADNPAGQY